MMNTEKMIVTHIASGSNEEYSSRMFHVEMGEFEHFSSYRTFKDGSNMLVIDGLNQEQYPQEYVEISEGIMSMISRIDNM